MKIRLAATIAAFFAAGVGAQDAPMDPPRLESFPPQRVGDVVIDAGAVPVWTAPAADTRPPQVGQQVNDPAILSRIPAPPSRRRTAVATLEGAAARPEWRAIVPAGHAVVLASALMRIAPAGLKAPSFEGVDGSVLQAPVSWSGGIDRATALEAVLRANGLRAVVSDTGLTVTRVALATPAIDEASHWRKRAAELEASANEARRSELSALARDREELEARRIAAEVQVNELREAAEKMQQEHRSRLGTLGVAFTDRQWKLSPEDSTLRQALARWARLEGVGFAWEPDYDLPVVAEVAYKGPLPLVLDQLLDKVPPDAGKLIYSLDRRHGLVVRRAPQS